MFDDLENDDDDPATKESVRWLSLARVHTGKKTLARMRGIRTKRSASSPLALIC